MAKLSAVSKKRILTILVEKHDIKAKEEQVMALIQEFAESYEQPEEVIAWYKASPERLQGPESMVLEDNVVEFVLSQAKVSEKSVSFDELMGNA